MAKFISTKFTDFITESVIPNLDSMPQDIRETLLNEYRSFFIPKFDWNSKVDEFGEDVNGFEEWRTQNMNNGLSKNLDTLIRKTREDLIHLRKLEISEKALEYFEELIIPTLDNSVLVGELSKFAEQVLLSCHTISDLNNAMKDAKNIIDDSGSIDYDKITQSDLFTGDIISLPRFERFAMDNPEYMGVFNDWKKLFDKYIYLSLKSLNAFRDSTPYHLIRNLHDYLYKLKNNK